jgi:YVTN family beta-propeller protein
VDFRILGPLEVSDQGREPAIAAGKQRALLAILLLHANEVVSNDRLIEELWGERAPGSAAKRLQVHVSRLRHALERDDGDGADSVVVTRGGGYLIRVEPGELDLERFERMLEEGSVALADRDPERALELLREALALWRGPPLAEFAYEPFAQQEIARLEELHLTALEQRIDAELTLGRHAQLIAELETLVKRQPFRERLRAQLMLALYRSGRQAEALQAYQQARRTLVEELGIEPSRELEELQRAILAQDPVLDAPAAASIATSQEGAPPAQPPDGARAPPGRRPGRALAAAAILAATLAGIVVLLVGRFGDDRGGSAPLTDDSHAVVVIDPASSKVTAAVSVGTNPGPLAFEPRSRSLWVGNIDDRTVTRIEPRPIRTGRTIAVGERPAGLAAGQGAVWVAAATRGKPFVTARRIDARFDSDRAAIRIESLPQGDASIALGHGVLWVAPSFGLLTRIDPKTGRVEAPGIDAGHAPTAVAADDRAVWVADSGADVVTRIDPRSGAPEAIPVPGGPADIALGAGAAWVSLSYDDSLARIDAASGSVRDTVDVGRRPAGVAVGAGAVWVANSGDGTVSRLDPRSSRVIATVEVGASPQDVVVADGRVWVSVRPRPADEPGKEGGTVRVETAVDVDFLDPALAYLPLSWHVLYPTCAQLLNYPDKGGPAGAHLEPELAAAIPRPSDGGRTYTFRIRRGFRYSPPSGEPVTAQAIKYSIERTLHPRMHSPAAPLLRDLVGARAYESGRARHISGVTAAQDKLTLRLTRPASDFLARISLPFFCAVPIGTPIDPDGLRTVPTAGPYYASSHLPGEQIVLERNPNYHGPRQRRPDEVRITVGSREGQAVARAEANEVDYVPFISDPSSARRLEARYGAGSAAAESGSQRYFVHTLLGLDYLAFNTSRPPFSSARLRRAVNYALDRRTLAREGLINPLPAAPTDQYLPPGMRGFRDFHLYPKAPDLAKARQLAGNERRTAVLYTDSSRPAVRFAEIVKANLRAIGMDVQIKKLGSSVVFRAGRRDEPFDMAVTQWFGDYPDPISFLSLLDGRTIRQDENLNLAYFNEAAYNRRLDTAAGLPSPARELALGRLDAQVARTAAPWAAVANERAHDFFSDRMGCQVFHPVFGVNLAALCIQRD